METVQLVLGGNTIPACETERPANSMSWSIEKAPVLMSSLSKAAAALEPRVWGFIVSAIPTAATPSGFQWCCGAGFADWHVL